MGGTGGAPLFAGLSPALRERVLEAGRRVFLNHGETVFRHGDQPDGIYILLNGQIKLETRRGGRERVIEVMETGRMLAEPAALAGLVHPVTATALTRCTLLSLDARATTTLLEQHPGFARWMLTAMAHRLYTMINDAEAVALWSGGQRVLASRLNLTAESLSRALRELTRARLIDVDAGVITIWDPEQLRARTRSDQICTELRPRHCPRDDAVP